MSTSGPSLPPGLLSALQSRGLPVADGATPGADQRLAWQREMERAQSRDWFNGALRYDGRPLAAGAQTAGPAGHGAVRGALAQVPAAQWLAVRARPEVAGDTARYLSAVAALPPAPHAGEVSATVSGLTAEHESSARTTTFDWGRAGPLGDTPALTPGAASAGSVADPGGSSVLDVAAAAGVAPLRLHLEMHDDGARLWIGAPFATALQIDQAIAEVRRRLLASGTALVGVICNGKPWDASRSDDALAHRGSNQINGG